jgi:transposase
MKDCATSHYWARENSAFGRNARLMPARYVKPFLKSQKNDYGEAEAIAKAVRRRLASPRSLGLVITKI